MEILLLILLIQFFMSKPNMFFPVKGKITSPFGNRIHPVTKVQAFHNGIDIGAPMGTPIYSPEAGRVINRYENATGGKQLIIEHTNGFVTGYAHLNDYAVKMGDNVKKGHLIGYVGATGRVTGPHLHLTLKKQGAYLDPEKYFE